MFTSHNPTIICVMGPTASGKSQLALTLAQALPLDIISVDSAQVYRGMDIGTAKPTLLEQAQIPHHLLDICDPSEAYSAQRFVEDAKLAIKATLAKNRIPLCVGGTMLYYRALQQGLHGLPSADFQLRQRLQKEIEEQGLQSLHQRLQKIDPKTAALIHENDKQRICRALEVYELTGQPLSVHWQQPAASDSQMNFVNFIIADPERSHLKHKITYRFNKMLQQGFIEEVEKLYHRKDLNLQLPALRAVGYRQIWQYLVGEWDLGMMKEKAIIATCQLAKRQLTWLRYWPHGTWFDAENPTTLVQVQEHIKRIADN